MIICCFLQLPEPVFDLIALLCLLISSMEHSLTSLNYATEVGLASQLAFDTPPQSNLLGGQGTQFFPGGFRDQGKQKKRCDLVFQVLVSNVINGLDAQVAVKSRKPWTIYKSHNLPNTRAIKGPAFTPLSSKSLNQSSLN